MGPATPGRSTGATPVHPSAFLLETACLRFALRLTLTR